MSINTKRELLQRIRREYAAANRKRKHKLLNSLIEATGYNRKYATFLLNKAPVAKTSQVRTRKSKYGSEVVDAVLQLWRAANGICARRLKPFLPTLIETLERCGHMKLGKRLKQTILEMSSSTLERMLKKERDKEPKGKSLTRPGSMLRKQIAVKTFAEWNDQRIGFLEIDLVAHCGDDVSGRFLQTLTTTDIASGWTELVPLLRKAETHVRAGLEKAATLLPFKLKGIDCDNGGEFLNHQMVAWCKAKKITFTRSRAYRKNDQAHVEEKNGSVVRRLVGYERFEGHEALEVMTQLYAVSDGNGNSPNSNGGNAKEQRSRPVRAERKRKKQNSSRPEVRQIPRIEITEAFVDNAVHPTSGQTIYRDSKLIGFGLRATPGGKSFIVESRMSGPSRRLTIGRADLLSVEEARADAAQLLRQMHKGMDILTLRKEHRRN